MKTSSILLAVVTFLAIIAFGINSAQADNVADYKLERTVVSIDGMSFDSARNDGVFTIEGDMWVNNTDGHVLQLFTICFNGECDYAKIVWDIVQPDPEMLSVTVVDQWGEINEVPLVFWNNVDLVVHMGTHDWIGTDVWTRVTDDHRTPAAHLDMYNNHNNVLSREEVLQRNLVVEHTH